jgi:hypothetical protein
MPDNGVFVTVSLIRKRKTASCPAIGAVEFDFEAGTSIVNSTSTPSFTIFCGFGFSCALAAVKLRPRAQARMVNSDSRIVFVPIIQG